MLIGYLCPNWSPLVAFRPGFTTIGGAIRSALACVVIISVVAGLASKLQALNLYWDIKAALPGATNNSDAPGFWSNNSWSTDIGGGAETGPWAADSTAVFSAGGNATGPFSVNLSSPQSVGDIVFE